MSASQFAATRRTQRAAALLEREIARQEPNLRHKSHTKEQTRAYISAGGAFDARARAPHQEILTSIARRVEFANQ
jgi:hypothetical protein